MPTTKNALLRYKVLDKCFSNYHHQYTIDDLIEAVNAELYEISGTEVKLRQIRQDIADMRDPSGYAAPIKTYIFDGKKRYYQYSDPNFSIFKNGLSTKAVADMQSLIELLKDYRGIKNPWLEEIINKLQHNFGIMPDKENLIEFEQNEQLAGIEHLSTVIDATLNHYLLEITYQSFNGPEQTFNIYPYYVKQYNSRWYLFGCVHGEDRITNLALDRMKFVIKYKTPFQPNTEIDFKHYFDHIIGVTLPPATVPVEDVILKFDKKRFPYVVSKPIHKSQTIYNEAECTIKISVKPNPELESQIFSFGPQVEVLEPEWLREKISDKIYESCSFYFSMQEGCTEES